MNTDELIKNMMEVSGKKTQKAFSKWMDVSQSYVTKWKTQGYIPDEYVKKFNSEFGEIFTVPDEFTQIASNNFNKDVLSDYMNDVDNKNTIDIKYFSNSYGSMGEGGVSYETLPSVMSFDKDFLVNAIGIQNFKDLFIINAVGNSMSPTIEDNSKLFITPFENEGNTFIDGGVYVIYAPQSGYLVKRVMLNSFDGSITLQSDNENYDNVVMTKDILDDCKVVGRVVGNFSSKV